MTHDGWKTPSTGVHCAFSFRLMVTISLLVVGLGCAGTGSSNKLAQPVASGGNGNTATPDGSGSATGTGGATASSSGSTSAPPNSFLFAGAADKIWSGQIDGTFGQVTPLPITTTDGADIVALTADPQGRFLYTAQQAASAGNVSGGHTGIGFFAIDSATGALTRGTTAILSGVPTAINADPLGRAVYLTQNGAIRVFSVGPGGFTSVAGSPFPANTVGTLTAMTPDARFLINVGGGNAAVFALDAITGIPTEISGSPFSTGASGEQDVVVSSSGRFLLILNDGGTNGSVNVLTIQANGSLTPVPECFQTSPKTVGCVPPPVIGPVSPRSGTSATPRMVVDPNGALIYILAEDQSGASRVIGLNIGLSGALGLNSGSPYATDISPNSIAMDAGGHFLYLSGSAGPPAQSTLYVYSIDPTTGALTQVSASPNFPTNASVVSIP